VAHMVVVLYDAQSKASNDGAMQQWEWEMISQSEIREPIESAADSGRDEELILAAARDPKSASVRKRDEIERIALASR